MKDEIKISSKGQIVLPKYIRIALDLQPGAKMLVAIENKKIILIPKPDKPLVELERMGQDIALKGIRKEIKEE